MLNTACILATWETEQSALRAVLGDVGRAERIMWVVGAEHAVLRDESAGQAIGEHHLVGEYVQGALHRVVAIPSCQEPPALRDAGATRVV